MSGRRHLIEERLTFGDLFEKWEPFREWSPGGRYQDEMPFSYEQPLTDEGELEGYRMGMRLSLFCAAELSTGTYYLQVWPKKEIADLVFRNTIHIDGETMNFRIIQGSRKDCALVVCHHGRIIGGPWIADIELEGIPTPPPEDQP